MRFLWLLLLLPFLTGCPGTFLGGMNSTESLEVMRAQNARGCIFIMGNATSFASARFIVVGTWGDSPPSYEECWRRLPMIP